VPCANTTPPREGSGEADAPLLNTASWSASRSKENEMEWRTWKPVKPGLYWAYDESHPDYRVSVVDVYVFNDTLVGFELGDNYDMVQSLSNWTHWMGPLPVPDAPKKP
jgi:hypothetical protein